MNSKYFKVIKNNLNGVRLFCFPYAGGNASIYYSWKEKFSNVEILACQLPGRSELLDECIINKLHLLIELLYQEIKPFLDKPFIFFGHSMGGVIVYALTQYIEKNSEKKPNFIIISAVKAPHFYIEDNDHLLSNESLKLKLKEHNETPAIVLDSKELMDIILPIYRADCKLLETNEIDKTLIKTKTFLFNCEEDIEKSIILEWNNYLEEDAKYITFQGGHFFLNTEGNSVIETISRIIKETGLG